MPIKPSSNSLRLNQHNSTSQTKPGNERGWAIAGLVIGSFAALVGAAAMIAVKTHLFSNIDLENLKHMRTIGSGALLFVGGAGALGSGLYICLAGKDENKPKVIKDSERESMIRALEIGEGVVYLDEDNHTYFDFKTVYGHSQVKLEPNSGTQGWINQLNIIDVDALRFRAQNPIR